MAKEAVRISTKDVDGVDSLQGKYLRHIRLTEDGLGFAFCFGDRPSSDSGHLVLCKMVQEGTKIQIQLHMEGSWKDTERVIFERK